MKFLCVTCDEKMTMDNVKRPQGNSLAVVYTCPSCSHQIAMLTNSHETQMIDSLGVRIGPKADGEDAGVGGCPFSDVVQGITADPVAEGTISWTNDARDRLARIPDFVRPMAVSGIEKYAAERGHSTIDIELLNEARGFFGM